MRKRVTWGAWLVTAALLLAGCGAGSRPVEPPGTSPAQPPSTEFGESPDPGPEPQDAAALLWQEVPGSGGRAYTLEPFHGRTLLDVDAGAGLAAFYVDPSTGDDTWHDFWVVDLSDRQARRLGRLWDPAPPGGRTSWTDAMTVQRLHWYRRGDGSRTLLVFVHGRIPPGLPAQGSYGAQLLALHYPSGDWEPLGFVESPGLAHHIHAAAFGDEGLLQVLVAGTVDGPGEEALYRFAPDRPEAERVYGPVDSVFWLPLHVGSRGRVLAWARYAGAFRLADLSTGETIDVEPGAGEYYTLLSVHPGDGCVLMGVTPKEYVRTGAGEPEVAGYVELRLLAPDGSLVARWEVPGGRLAGVKPVWSAGGQLAFVEGEVLEGLHFDDPFDLRPEVLVVWDPLADPQGHAAARVAVDGAAPERLGELAWLDGGTVLLRGEYVGHPTTALEVDVRTGALTQVTDPHAVPRPLPKPLQSLPAAARRFGTGPTSGCGSSGTNP
nr:hypothetical protein [Bacillota bacterium]